MSNSTRRQEMVVRLVGRDGWVCHLCGDPIDPSLTNRKRVTIDHIVPRSEGGNDQIDNLALAHAVCNHTRGNAPLGASSREETRRVAHAPRRPGTAAKKPLSKAKAPKDLHELADRHVKDAIAALPEGRDFTPLEHLVLAVYYEIRHQSEIIE